MPRTKALRIASSESSADRSWFPHIKSMSQFPLGWLIAVVLSPEASARSGQQPSAPAFLPMQVGSAGFQQNREMRWRLRRETRAQAWGEGREGGLALVPGDRKA